MQYYISVHIYSYTSLHGNMPHPTVHGGSPAESANKSLTFLMGMIGPASWVAILHSSACEKQSIFE